MRNLLIIGAGMYSVVVYETAKESGAFSKIDFVDDHATITPVGIAVKGKVSEVAALSRGYTDYVVAIGDPGIRLGLLKEIKSRCCLNAATIVSPRAYVSPSARLGEGCIVEPMAVVHSLCKISDGCLISAGAVVNHAAELGEGVHVDCNATVEGYAVVDENVKICSGEVYRK